MTATLTPSVPSLAPGSDTGISDSDNLTNATQLTVNGTAVANATIKLYDTDGTTVLGTATASSTGSYSVMVASKNPLTQGIHDLTVTATAAGFDESAHSTALEVTIDTTAPAAPSSPALSSISDTGVSAADGITSATSLQFTGFAEPGATVQVFDGSTTPLGQAQADGNGAYSITITAPKAGTYSFTTTATDAAGNVSKASAASTVVIDTSAPAAPTVQLAPGSDTGALHNDDLTNDQTPVITGTAEANATVTLYDTDGTVLGTTKADAAGNYAITASFLNQGPHSLSAKASDAAGNVSQASQPLSISIDVVPASATSTPNTLAAYTDSVTFAVHFNQPVAVPNLGTLLNDLTLVTTGTASGALQNISGSGQDYSVTVNGLAGDGTIGLGFTGNSTLTDAAGNRVSFSESDLDQVNQTDLPITTEVSASASGADGDGEGSSPSASGRAVAFESPDDDLTPNVNTNDTIQIYVKDQSTGGISLVSLGQDGTAAAGGLSGDPSLSTSGKVITFDSYATDLVPGGTAPGSFSTYVEDLTRSNLAPGSSVTVVPGSIQLVAEDFDGVHNSPAGGGDEGEQALSGDGTHVAFVSNALQGADYNEDVYLYDMSNDALTLVSHDAGDAALGGNSDSFHPSISNDGTVIAFVTEATNISTDTNEPFIKSYVYNGATDTMTALDAGSFQAVEISQPSVSGNGQWVVYTATLNYSIDGSAAHSVVLEKNLVSGALTQISPTSDYAGDPSVSAGGRYVLYTSNLDGLGASGPPNQLVLFDTLTQTSTIIGTGYDGHLSLEGNAATYTVPGGSSVSITTEDGEQDSNAVYSTTFGPTIGINVIASDDRINHQEEQSLPDGVLTVSGTSDAPDGSGAIIRIFSNGNPVDVASGSTTGGVWSGTFTAQQITALPDGSYEIVAQIGASSGSSTLTARPFTIDTTAPNTPATPKLQTGEDKSTAQDGSLTNTDTPVLIGTTEAYATVTLIDQGGLTPGLVLGTTTADSNGLYAVTSTALTQGQHSLAVEATDAAGNVSAASKPLNVTLDSVAPDRPNAPVLGAGQDTGASDSDGIIDSATPIVTGTAEPGSTVTLYDSDGKAALGTATANKQTGAYSITTSQLSDGAHTLTVTATDAAGNASDQSATLAITVDTQPPAAPTITQVSGTVVNGSSLGPVIDVLGTAEPGSTVTLHVDGDDGGSGDTTADAEGDFDLTSELLQGGSHTLTVTATDVAGNVGQASLPTSVSIAGQTPYIPPTIPVNEPPTDGTASDGYIVGGTVFNDSNGDGVPDNGEFQTLTDISGKFQYYEGNGTLTLTGGLDTGTGLTLPGNLQAADGATVISPLTTYELAYATAAGANAASDATQASAATALGLNAQDPAGNFLLNLDPVADLQNGDGAPAVADAQLADAAADFAAVIAGAGGGTEGAAFTAAFDAIGRAAAAGSVDLTDQTTLAAILSDAATEVDPGLILSSTVADAAAAVVAASNATLAADLQNQTATHLPASIEAAEVVAQGFGASELASVAQDPSRAAAVVASLTGSNLSSLLSQALKNEFAPPQLSPSSDTGRSQDDDITDDASPTFIGQAQPGATVVIATQRGSQAQVMGVGTADSTGHYSIATVTSSAVSAYYVFATETSPQSIPAVGSFISYANEPTTFVLVDNGGSGSLSITQASQQAVSGDDASDSGLVVGGSLQGTPFADTVTISIYADGNPTPIGTGTSINGQFGVVTSALSNGFHTLTAVGTEASGRTISTTSPFSVRINALGDVSGQAAADGPLANASIFYGGFVQGNATVREPQDVGTTTDANGQYTIAGTSPGYQMRLQEGWDTLTGLPFAGAAYNGLSLGAVQVNEGTTSLLAPEGATVITPLTSVVTNATGYFSGDTGQASAMVAAGLGLSSNLDLLSLDPLSEAENGDPSAFLASVKVLDTVTMLSPLLGAGFTFAPIAADIHANGSINLDDPASILWILNNTSSFRQTLPQADFQPIADIIAASNAAIDADAAGATGFTDLVAETLAAQDLAQEDETSALNTLILSDADTSGFQALEQNYTGTNLQSAITGALSRFTQVSDFAADDTAPTDAATEHFTLTFTNAVSHVVAGDFSVVASSGLTGVHVTGVTEVAGSNGTSWDVAVATGVGQGTIALTYSAADVLNGAGLPITNGTFETPQFYSTYALNAGSPGIALGDFNGDGRLDILALGQQDGEPDGLDLYVNEGGGKFQELAPIAKGYGYGGALATGDFNGDGKLDAVATDIGVNSVAVLLDNRDGSFQSQIDTATGDDPDSVVVGDFDGDGKQDIAVGNAGDGTISILLGNGDGTFHGASNPTLQVGPGATTGLELASADFNGDGTLDLIATDYTTGTVSLWLGNGDGTFAPAQAVATGLTDVFGIAVADLNGDGIPDIVVGSHSGSSGNEVSILLGKGDGTFTTGASYAVQGFIYSLAVADINNDKQPDIVVATADGTFVFLGTGTGAFTPGYTSNFPVGGNSGPTLALGDLDGDGRTDLVMQGSFLGPNQSAVSGINVLLNAPESVLDSNSDAVTIDRPQAAAPALTQTSGAGTLTQNGNTYTLDLGVVPQGQTLGALQFALNNIASASSDSFDGSFDMPAGGGFTVTGATLPGALAPGQSYDGLSFTVDTSSAGTHTETLTFAPRDVEVTQPSEVNVSGTDQDLVSPTDNIGPTVAGELPPITLVVEDDVEPLAFTPAAAQIEDVSGPGTFTQSGSVYTLDFGPIWSAKTVTLDVLNSAAAPADTLGGSFTISGDSAFTNNGFTPFSGIAAGTTQSGLSVTLNGGTPGTYSETITLDPTDSNAITLGTETLIISGTVEPCGATGTLAGNTDTVVSAGSDVDGAAVTLGMTLKVLAGATATGVTVSNGGLEDIYGSAVSTTVTEGGGDYVESGGFASATDLLMCTEEFVEAGGSTTGTIVTNEAEQLVYLSGQADGTVISSGGLQAVAGYAGGTIVSADGEEYIGTPGVATGTQIEAGGIEAVFGIDNDADIAGIQYDFATANGATVESGGLQYLESGTTESAAAIESGGEQYIASGAVASATMIEAGGAEVIVGVDAGATVISGTQYDFGTASGGTVDAGGFQWVEPGATAIGLTVDSGAQQYIGSGGTALDTIIVPQAVEVIIGTDGGGALVSGTQYVFGTASGGTTFDGGSQQVESGSTAIGMTVSSGGLQFVGSSGTTIGTVIEAFGAEATSGTDSGVLISGTQYDFGSASGGTVFADAFQWVEPGATAAAMTVSGGGQQYIGSGGTALATDIAPQGAEVIFGADSGALVSGTQYVFAIASGGTTFDGGSQQVESGGTAIGMTVASGGQQDVGSGGTAIGTEVMSQGAEIVHGTDLGATVSGTQYVDGLASGTVVGTGGYQLVSAGGTISAASISGGTIELSSGASAGAAAITFAGAGQLLLDASTTFSGTVAGFASASQADAIDFADIPSMSAGSAGAPTVDWTAGNGSGTLSVSAGGHTANVTLLGQYTGTFNASAAGGGTLVTYAPATAATDSSPMVLTTTHPG